MNDYLIPLGFVISGLCAGVPLLLSGAWLSGAGFIALSLLGWLGVGFTYGGRR